LERPGKDIKDDVEGLTLSIVMKYRPSSTCGEGKGVRGKCDTTKTEQNKCLSYNFLKLNN
jgi:hypothetical protein